MEIDPSKINGFLNYSTGNICDANGKQGNMDQGIKPLDPGSRLAGQLAGREEAIIRDLKKGLSITEADRKHRYEHMLRK